MKLTLVNKTDEAKDTKSFFFTSDTPFAWKAGQYLYITLNKITKPFTIASSPTEKTIQITTRIRQDSKFKQNLDKIEIGQEIEARGPFGSFVLEKNTINNIFLAGGIGITPFRSFIKYNIDKKLGISMFLIYSNSDLEFVFKKELDKWQKENDNLKIYYHNSSVSGHLDSSKLSSLLSTYYILHTTYYTVGPNPFVNAMEDILEDLKFSSAIKIPAGQIKTEKFTGY